MRIPPHHASLGTQQNSQRGWHCITVQFISGGTRWRELYGPLLANCSSRCHLHHILSQTLHQEMQAHIPKARRALDKIGTYKYFQFMKQNAWKKENVMTYSSQCERRVLRHIWNSVSRICILISTVREAGWFVAQRRAQSGMRYAQHWAGWLNSRLLIK
jgi:hypothetical protein